MLSLSSPKLQLSLGCILTVTSLVACGLYYYVWIHLLPKLRHYQMRQQAIEDGDGVVQHVLVKVPEKDLTKWDAEHDVTGRAVRVTGYDTKRDTSS